MAGKPLNGEFSHVEAWVFDLDNTLYPADCNLFAEIDTRMGEFIAERFGVSQEEAQRMRKTYYYEYGTTLAGLMRLHNVPPNAFLDYVHDIDLSVIEPAPDLRDALDALPGRKFVFTNGSRRHAESVIARLGIDGRFDDLYDIHASSSSQASARLTNVFSGRTALPAHRPPCSTICRTIFARRTCSA
jgi:putative hydrolase of the HAD superfamily